MSKSIPSALAMAFAAVMVATPAEAGDRRAEAAELIEDASETVAYFADDTAFEPLWDLADTAKAMVIVPQSIRAGFILGGAAGDGVLVARNKDGTWSQPTFLTVGSLSVGLQAGGEVSEIILLVMTQRGMEQLLSTSVKLGADLSVAAGPIGAGAKAQTTDILAFSRSRGLYGGISLEGAVLKTRRNWNKAYYAADVSPPEVIYGGEAYNPASAQLQNAVWRLANKDAPALIAPAVAPANAPKFEDDAAFEMSVPREAAPAAPASDDPYEDDAAWGAPVKRDE